MRFDRFPRFDAGVLEWTARKEAAYRRKLERVRARLPLLTDQTPLVTPDLDAELERRRARSNSLETTLRQLHAGTWRKARRAYFASSLDVRAAILLEWNAWTGPAKPLNFLYVVERHTGISEQRRFAMRRQEAAVRATVLAGLRAQQSLFDDTQ